MVYENQLSIYFLIAKNLIDETSWTDMVIFPSRKCFPKFDGNQCFADYYPTGDMVTSGDDITHLSDDVILILSLFVHLFSCRSSVPFVSHLCLSPVAFLSSTTLVVV